MRVSEPAAENYKRVCEDFLNLVILRKSPTPGKVQLTFSHSAVGNKSLGKSVVDFTLAGDISSPYFIYLKIDISFSADGNNISLPIAELLLRAANGNLVHPKKQQDWTPRNAFPLPPFSQRLQSSTGSRKWASS